MDAESCTTELHPFEPPHRNHVRRYDFVEAQTHDGSLTTFIDEFTREYLAVRVARPINNFGVIETMGRSDARQERAGTRSVRQRCGDARQDQCVAGSQNQSQRRSSSSPASTWENSYCESFNAEGRPTNA